MIQRKHPAHHWAVHELIATSFNVAGLSLQIYLSHTTGGGDWLPHASANVPLAQTTTPPAYIVSIAASPAAFVVLTIGSHDQRALRGSPPSSS